MEDKLYYLSCNKCGEHYMKDGNTVLSKIQAQLRIDAKVDGWNFVDDSATCKECMTIEVKAIKETN